MLQAARCAIFAMFVGSPALLGDGQAFAQASSAQVVPVQLSSYRFMPARLELVRGQTYVLRLRNVSGKGHDLTAKAFFQTVRLAAGSQEKLEDGRIAVGADQSVDIELTPQTAGAYEMHCSRPFHSMQGMKGEIIVR